MVPYDPPIADILHALRDTGLEELCGLEAHGVADADDCAVVIEEFARFAVDVIAPTDRVGDREGVHLTPATGAVTTPTVFPDAWRRYVESGYGAISVPASHGGGSFP